MSRKFVPWFCGMGCLLLTACGEDAAFQRWEQAWEQAPKGVYPAAADEAIPSAEEIGKELEQYRLLAESFQQINPAVLEKSNQQRWNRYAAGLKAALESREHLAEDPAAFDIGRTLETLFQNDSGALDGRLTRIEKCLTQAPAYYETAKILLRRPDPEQTLLAIENQLQTLRLLRDYLPALLATARLEEATKERISQKAYFAKLAVKDYLAFCESLHFEHSDTTLVRRLGR
ncbi:MAG: hypothetical protein ACKV1O_13160 [Saprospiraceae bacterium]